MSDVVDRVKKIVVEHLSVEESSISDTSSFIDDLGADSLDTVELVMAFEEEFGIEIPDDAAETIQTVGDAVKFIEESECIVICMAWLTNQKVVKALTKKPCVLILQNESWLNKKGGLAKKTREMYSQLRQSTTKFMSDTLTTDIRTCGMISHPQNMHHKFAVRIMKDKPVSVWTGSFNPTTNGNQSIENALVIHNEQIASAYFQEFLGVKAISKPLKV